MSDFIAVGDLDGDRKPDVVVPNSSVNTVSVFRNLSTPGMIAMADRIDLAAGSGPYGIGIRDLDGDGKPDMAVTNWEGTLSVFRNLSMIGTISFAAKQDFATHPGPRDVVLADMDGNGRPDMIVTHEISSVVSVYRNLHLTFIHPVEPWTKSGFGWDDPWKVDDPYPCYTNLPRAKNCDPLGRRRFRHLGFDASCEARGFVRASADGVVMFTPKNLPGGLGGGVVVLQHDLDQNPATTDDLVTTLYLHVDPVVSGGSVKQGDVIAQVSNIQGPHLHFGFRRAPFDDENPSASHRGALPPKGTIDCVPCYARPVPLPAFPEKWENPELLFR